MLAQAAVLQKTFNSQLPTAEQTALNHPLIHQWKAHTAFKPNTGDGANGIAVLHTLQAFVDAGGIPDRYDIALAIYAGFFVIENNVKSLMTTDMSPTHPGWAVAAKDMLAAADLLAKILAPVEQKDQSQELEAALQLATSNSKNDRDQKDVIIAHILSECLERGDTIEDISARYVSSRKKELQLTGKQHEELNKYLHTIRF